MAMLCAGCAGDGVWKQRADATRLQQTVRLLEGADDADSLAAASVLSVGEAPAQRLDLMARAVERAPVRADLLWLELQMCAPIDSCDSTPIEQRLHAADPGNAAAWAVSVRRAGERGDAVTVNAVIEAMAASERFDIYWNELILHTTNAVLKVHTLNPQSALVDVIGFLSARAIPAYKQIGHACRGEALSEATWLATCRRLAAVLRAGDTYITEMFGVSIDERVWPEDSAEFQESATAKQLARYRMQASVDVTSFGDAKHLQRYFELLAMHRTEQEVVAAELMDAGVSPTPPQDWKDTLAGGS